MRTEEGMKPGVRGTLETAASGPESPSGKRGEFTEGYCGWPACGRRFEPRRQGRLQRFCSATCRRLFDNELRREGRRAKPERRRVGRSHPDSYWRSGIDTATGRRVPVAIKTPAELLAEIRREAAS